jgi:signal transduction histidine kinase
MVRRGATTAVVVTVALATTALMAVAWFFAALNGDLDVFTSPFGPDLVLQVGILPVAVIIALRRPANALGWLFLGCTFVGAVAAAAGEYAVRGLLTPAGLPAVQWAAWLSNWIITLIFPAGAFLFVVLLFPTGRLVSQGWRILAWTAVVVTLAVATSTALSDYPIAVAPNVRLLANPIGIRGFATSILGRLWVVYPASVVLLLVAGASLVVRYRRSSGEERQQIKWFTYTVAATLAAFAASFPLSVVSTSAAPVANGVLEIGLGVALPIACAIAILKYRLYGIDVVISRTLVYGTLAVLITGVYVGIAVGVGSLVGSGGKPNLGLSILATAIVAVGFQPVRAHLQRLANRVVYGERASPYEVLSEFSERVAETYAAEELLPRMARVLREGTGAASATVWLRSGDQLRPAAAYPEESDSQHSLTLQGSELPGIPGVQRAVPVLHQGDLLGALTITKRRGEALTPIEEKLLDDLARQAGLVLKNVGLTAELLQHLEELRASRQRLVTAQDDERRRLERNLHDGAQQHLVALKVKLGLAEMMMDRDPAKARVALQQLKDDADEALETLRDLARGIYPPILADQGLVAALQAQARKATLPVVVGAGALNRHQQAQEAAVYFCVMEALQNVQKYACASHATVRLTEDGSELRFEVEDDGRGFDVATVRRGTGLTNLADRLDALGGRLHIDSRVGEGCRLRGSLPVLAPDGDLVEGAGQQKGRTSRPELNAVAIN